MEWIILLIIGLVSGTIGSLVGLGGGLFIVPSLLFFGLYTSTIHVISPQVAVGTSLVVIIFTGLSSTLAYMKQNNIDYKSGLLFFLGSGPGGIAGAWVNKFLDMQSFFLYFGSFMILLSLILMIEGRLKPIPSEKIKGIKKSYLDPDGVEYFYGYRPSIAIIISFIVGLFSGLFGIGGGSLMVPAMILLFRFPTHTAIATSMFMIFFSAIVGSIAHISLGNVDWMYTLALIPGAWFGGKAGALLSQKLSGNMLVIILRIILIVLGIRLIFQGIS